MTTPLAQLRELAERLPAGAAVMLTKEYLLALTAEAGAEHPAPASDAVFTVATLAAYLHRPRSTIRGWCERGDIAAVRRKSCWFITAEAVQAFLSGAPPKACGEDGPGPLIPSPPNTQPHPPRARPSAEPRIDDWRRVRPKGQP